MRAGPVPRARRVREPPVTLGPPGRAADGSAEPWRCAAARAHVVAPAERVAVLDERARRVERPDRARARAATGTACGARRSAQVVVPPAITNGENCCCRSCYDSSACSKIAAQPPPTLFPQGTRSERGTIELVDKPPQLHHRSSLGFYESSPRRLPFASVGTAPPRTPRTSQSSMSDVRGRLGHRRRGPVRQTRHGGTRRHGRNHRRMLRHPSTDWCRWPKLRRGGVVLVLKLPKRPGAGTSREHRAPAGRGV